ncbi:MAG: hypothetical protein QXE79_00755 [Candidatus Bathyarchaeia archaeon]
MNLQTWGCGLAPKALNILVEREGLSRDIVMKRHAPLLNSEAYGSLFKCSNCRCQSHADYNGAMDMPKRAEGLASIAGLVWHRPNSA